MSESEQTTSAVTASGAPNEKQPLKETTNDQKKAVNTRHGHRSHITVKINEFEKILALPDTTIKEDSARKVAHCIKSINLQRDKITPLDETIVTLRDVGDVEQETVEVLEWEDATDYAVLDMISFMHQFAVQSPASPHAAGYVSIIPAQPIELPAQQPTARQEVVIPATISIVRPGEATTVDRENTAALNTGAPDQVKLGKINQPMFDGKYSEYLSFMDQFNASVHVSTKLSNAQKLNYLINAMEGEAKTLIGRTPITNNNYEVALAALKDRFGATEIIQKTYFDTILDLPQAKEDSAVAIRTNLSAHSTSCAGLQQLGHNLKDMDAILAFTLARKLHKETKKQWDLERISGIKNLDELCHFLKNRAKVLEIYDGGSKQPSSSAIAPATSQHNAPSRSSYNRFQNTYTSTIFEYTDEDYANQDREDEEDSLSYQTYTQQRHVPCPACNGTHPLFVCQQFKAMDKAKQKEVVVRARLCWNCLFTNHIVKHCPSKSNCKICNKRHHTILHPSDEEPKPTETQTDQSFVSVINHVTAATSTQRIPENTTTGILATARIRVTDKNGNEHTLRALLDSGSQANFITAKATRKLGFTPSGNRTVVNGLGSTTPQTTEGIVSAILHAKNGEKLPYEFHSLPTLTLNLPAARIDTSQIQDVFAYDLADKKFYIPAPIDLLLGVDIYNHVVTGKRELSGALALWHTAFGWTISGPATTDSHTSTQSFPIIENFDLSKFWEVEELPEGKREKTSEEIEAEQDYDENTKIDTDGLAIVSLPFRQDAKPLGHMRSIAIKRFLSQERKLLNNPEMHEDYKKFMNGFIDMDHLKKMDEGERYQLQDSESYYLCHSAVFKADSTTTPMRVVFDGGARTSNGTSLNDNLLVGPQIQDNLYDVLLRMRLFRVVATGDIGKMFRMLKLDVQHRNFHLVLWRDDPDAHLDTYRMERVTYGIAPSSYLAIRTLQELAKGVSDEMATIILRDFYVDDVITGADTPEEMFEIIQRLVELLKKRGFIIRKWACNIFEVIAKLPVELRENEDAYTIGSEDHSIKTLGMCWMMKQDSFAFSLAHIQDHDKLIATKRELVADVAKIFDPMGLASPVIIKLKMYLQMCWTRGLGWDDNLPEDIKESYDTWRTQLCELRTMRIERCVLPPKKPVTFQVHVFADASQLAYGACVYTRIQDTEGNIATALLTSKTKVAPIKTLTIPRLELQAATMGAKLATSVMRALAKLNLPFEGPFGWSDSTVTLAWISGESRQWSTFVANRVATIQHAIPPERWHHVPTKENPADLASRSVTPAELMGSTLWWKGPELLKEFDANEIRQKVAFKTVHEARTSPMMVLTATQQEPASIFLIARFSSLRRLVRTTCYVLRAVTRMRKGRVTRSRNNEITSEEEDTALRRLIVQEQKHHYPDEIAAIEKKKQVPKQSSIACLYPFMDNGALKVGGRLTLMDATDEEKFQIIVPKESHLATLLLRAIHAKLFHAGAQTCLAELRRKFWIPNARSNVRAILRTCTRCFRFNSIPQDQLMGDLPAARITESRPFAHTGIDFAGPFTISEQNQHLKAYLVVFVCFSTKAIHLEIATGLTTAACCAAVQRFVSRRSPPEQIYSDNGTNFVGTRNELTKIKDMVSTKCRPGSLAALATTLGSGWVHIPPRSPHFGGLWEAGVKAAKSLLRKVMGKSVVTYDELATIFAQVERILNSRPLVEVSQDPQDLQAITPSMLLTGYSSREMPLEPKRRLGKLPIHPNHRWRYIQNFIADFWARWKKEYLPTLQPRSKWSRERVNLKVNDLVLVMDDGEAPLVWPLARIIETYTGNDALVRAAKILTTNGTYVRPVAKLRKLPFDPDHSDFPTPGKATQGTQCE